MVAAYLTRVALRSPRALLVLLGVVTAVAASGTPRLRIASYLDVSLPPGDEELARYHALEREFGSERAAVLALGCGAPRPCEDVFDPVPLAVVREITTAARRTEGVIGVRSLATASVLVGDSASLRSMGLPEEPGPEFEEFRARVARDPILKGTLVSTDLRTTAIEVRFDASLSDPARNRAALAVVDDARRLAQAAGYQLYASGPAVFTAFSNRLVSRDLRMLTPLMLALVSGLLFWLLRDYLSMGLALAAVGIPTVWCFGSMGWSGVPISLVFSALPVLVVVVGITDSVHFLVRLREIRPSYSSLEASLVAVAEEVGPPTTITAITSSLGFLSLFAGPIPMIRDFGLLAAVGIGGAWLLTFTLIPAALAIHGRISERLPRTFDAGNRLLGAMRAFAHGRAWWVLAATVATTGVSLAGTLRLAPETDAIKALGEGSWLAESVQFIRDRLRSPASIEVVYQVADGKALTDLSEIERMVAVERVLGKAVGSGPVLSLLPVLRVASREMIGGELDLPGSSEAASQLLLLAEAADPDLLRRLVTPDRQAARLSAAHPYGSSRDLRGELATLRAGIATALPRDATWWVTGMAFLTGHLADRVLETQISSFATAFLTILAVILVVVRSLPLAGLGMIPNLFPVIAALGFMGLADINLDVGTAMIASIVLGISVDDTIYFLVHYQRARRSGASIRDAVAYTFAIAGKPALFCTVVLALGFFVLAFSSFQSLALFGLISGLVVLLAGVAELLILPAVLEIAARRAGSP
jgi:predicted RND superfamily exporter protein